MIRKATGNRLYQSTEEMKESISTMLDNGEAGVVKISMLHNLLFKAIFGQDYPNVGRLCNMLVKMFQYLT